MCMGKCAVSEIAIMNARVLFSGCNCCGELGTHTRAHADKTFTGSVAQVLSVSGKASLRELYTQAPVISLQLIEYNNPAGPLKPRTLL